MNKENLRTFTSFLTDRMVVIRQSYCDRLLQGELKKSVGVENLSFEADAMYESWVNYAPHFFREMYADLSELRDHNISTEEIAKCLGSQARIPRYYTQLLLPGAYLDTTISEEDKIAFLKTFTDMARTVYTSRQYDEPDYGLLYDKSSSSEKMKLALAGRLIPRLEEACESIYFGDQNIGFPKFGLIKNGNADHTTLSQDFDLNLGPRYFSDFGRIKTYTTYSEETTDGRLTNILDIYVGSLFMHAQMVDTKWRLRRPIYSMLERGYVTVNNKVLCVQEINDLADMVPVVAKTVEIDRMHHTLAERKVEYCQVQSLPLRELGLLRGDSCWKLSKEAINSVYLQDSTTRLKSKWGLTHSVEVSTELVKRSVNWVKNCENL